MKQNWGTAALAMGIMLAAHGAVSGQTDDVQPVIISQYDLFAVENRGYRQLTEYPYNSELSTSPDGRYATYNSVPQVGIDAIERTGGFSGPMVNNVWIIDTVTGDAHRIAGQPDPAYFFDAAQPDNVIGRSRGAWAPDGSGVAWTDYLFADSSLRLGIYSVALDSYTSFPLDLPQQYGVPSPLPVIWTDAGIALISSSFFSDSPTGYVDEVMVYSRQGALIAAHRVPDVGETPPFIRLFTEHQGRSYYTQYDAANAQWVMMDILSGAEFTTTSMPEIVSTNVPIGSVALQLVGFRPYEQQLAGQSTSYLVGQVVGSDGNMIIEDFPIGFVSWDGSAGFYLAPDGQSFAYTPFNPDTRVRERDFTLWRNGEFIPFRSPNADFGVQEISWGGQRWVMPINATLTQIAASDIEQFSCPTALPPRLTVGETAVVLPGGANRIRAVGTTSAQIRGEIPVGGIFNVIGGPGCYEGIVWWQVEYNGITGWTAEGVDEYFVEPAP